MNNDELISRIGGNNSNHLLVTRIDSSLNPSIIKEKPNEPSACNIDMFRMNSGNLSVDIPIEFNDKYVKNENVKDFCPEIESFLISICELRYVILICIKWRLQNSTELIANTGTMMPTVNYSLESKTNDTNVNKGSDSCEFATPTKEYLLSYLFLYRSCISDSQKEELELQIVKEILRLIDPSIDSNEINERSYSRGGFKCASITESSEINEMRNAENTLNLQFHLKKLPFPFFETFLGKNTNESSIGDIINTTEHSSGLNLANVASTPSILGVLLKYFNISWPNHIFEFLFSQNESNEDPDLANDEKKSSSKDDLTQLVQNKEPGITLSLGSLTHVLGLCKPCVFVNKTNKKCRNGVMCCFCHFQHKERKRGKRYKSSNSLNNSSNVGGMTAVDTNNCVNLTYNSSRLDMSNNEDSVRVSSLTTSPVNGPSNSPQIIFGSGVADLKITQVLGSSNVQLLPEVTFASNVAQQLNNCNSNSINGTFGRHGTNSSSFPSCQSVKSSNIGYLKLNSIGCKLPKSGFNGEQVRYLIPPPPPPPPSKMVSLSVQSSSLQMIQSEKNGHFRTNQGPVATSTSAGYNQMNIQHFDKNIDGHSGGILDSLHFQGSTRHDSFFGDSNNCITDFNGYNKLINEASEMNNWISMSSDNSNNALNISSKAYFQWLNGSENEYETDSRWGSIDNLGSTQNLNLYKDDRIYMRTLQEWSRAAGKIREASHSLIKNEDYYIAKSSETYGSNAAFNLSESGLPILGRSDQPNDLSNSWSVNAGDELLKKTSIATESIGGDYFPNSSTFFAPCSNSTNSSGSSIRSGILQSSISNNGGTIPPFLKNGSVSAELTNDHSSLTFLTDMSSPSRDGSGLGMDFCFLNSWK